MLRWKLCRPFLETMQWNGSLFELSAAYPQIGWQIWGPGFESRLVPFFILILEQIWDKLGEDLGPPYLAEASGATRRGAESFFYWPDVISCA